MIIRQAVFPDSSLHIISPMCSLLPRVERSFVTVAMDGEFSPFPIRVFADIEENPIQWFLSPVN